MHIYDQKDLSNILTKEKAFIKACNDTGEIDSHWMPINTPKDIDEIIAWLQARKNYLINGPKEL